MVLAVRAEAGTCVVTTTADQLPTVPGSLRDCLEQAQANPGPDTITFDPSVFTGGAGVVHVTAGLPPIDDTSGPTTIDGSGAQVTISGDQVVDLTALTIASNGNTIRGLTIRDFSGTAPGFGDATAITVLDGFTGNVIDQMTLTADQGGGVILFKNNYGTVISNSQFTALDFEAVYVTQVSTPCGSPIQITGNTFQDNNPSGTDTDDIFVAFASCVEITGNSFANNGFNGVRVGSSTSTGTRIENNTFTNTNIGLYGGSKGTQFLGNTVTDSHLDFGDPEGTNVTIARNVFVGLKAGATEVIQSYPTDVNFVVAHNVFANIPGLALVTGGGVGYRIQNNAFVNVDTGLQINSVPDTETVISNNAFTGVTTPCTGFCVTSGDLMADPGFVSASDFHLTGCSAAGVDRGADLGSLQPDLTPPGDGVNFFGAAPDIGAFETNCGGIVVMDGGTPDAGTTDGGGGGALVFTSTPPETAVCGWHYEYQPVVSGGAVTSWSVSSALDGLSIDSTTGRVSWTPASYHAGAHDFDVIASGPGGEATQTVHVIVDCSPRIFGVGLSCGAAGGAVTLGAILFSAFALATTRRRRLG